MKSQIPSQKWASIILLIMVGLSVAACSFGNQNEDRTLPVGTYPVDPVFQEFYDKHGGVDFFGYAISTHFTEGGKRGQYFESVKMLYDMATGTISFEKLGVDLSVGELPVAQWQGPTEGGVYAGDHFIHPAFASIYLSIGSEMFGHPQTDPYVNVAQHRLEQHFETAGVYIDLNDPNARPALLHYGRLHCSVCSVENTSTTGDAIVSPMLTDASMYAKIEALGVDNSMIGKLVSGPSVRFDGTTDLVFDYMVLYEENGQLKIRNTPVQLGLKEDTLYLPSPDSLFVFYEIDGTGAGYNVFYKFDEFIQQQGGYSISGEPIRSLIQWDASNEELYQCFENYCLNYTPSTGVVRFVSLGQYYYDQNTVEYIQPKIGSEDENENFSDQPGGTTGRNTSFTVLAHEEHYNIDSLTSQVLTFWVKLQDTPQPGMVLDLTITYPDGQQEMVTLQPTDQEGKVIYVMPPISGPNGGLVEYEACLNYGNLPPACVDHVFMIWGNP